MATIGHTLAAARIAAGYTVADLSARTRIRDSVLEGIEEEDFVPCGGDFYARGHIRGLSRALGLDPAPLLAEYDREHASSDAPAFVPLPRHPAASPAAVRAAVAASRNGTVVVGDEEPMAGPVRRFGDDAADPGSNSEQWGHFERTQNLGRGLRRGRTRKEKAKEIEPEEAVAVPEPRSPERRRGTRGIPRVRDEHGTGPGDTRTVPRPTVTETRPGRGEAVRRHWPWAVVGIIILLGVVVGVRTWQDWEGDNPLRTAFESNGGGGTVDSAVLPEEGVEGAGEAAAAPAAKQAVEEPAEFTLGLVSAQRSWIKLTGADGDDLFTGFLLEDEEQEFTAEEGVMLWVGNAGAVQVSIDGKDIGPAGESGEVKEVAIGPDGFDQ
ncbi:helix-turn-helix domain-containing protein [Nocardiopsis sp. CT-R113]|uniref:Helix-turn-helix domain-containing protein n=1 Tax=Nocardiopsis codii TaxID=3065942 RepID=A0ABU7K0L0_9ACTN|nr:helix-turn-helix domain-containing protein [Nocardiopsis sp. CT-R113]MEE2035695.1 helix-turn-helix domain-containing protein [Nocardiopsis sp. CT-R113]